MSAHSHPTRPAATLILVRDGEAGPEVLLLKRSSKAGFIAGVHVFPGGGVEQADHGDAWTQASTGIDPEAADRALDLPSGALAYWVAALRECFEECGLLLASDVRGHTPDFSQAGQAGLWSELRRRLHQGQLSFAQLIREQGLRLAAEELIYFSHWIAPQSVKPRYDTRFFLAKAPRRQQPVCDEAEVTSHVWLRPEAALARQRAGDMELVFPTIRSLEALCGFADADSLIAHARRTRPAASHLPRLAQGRDGPKYLVEGDYAYAEVGKLDPEGKGTARYELLPGVPVPLSDRVCRITAPNAGMMTGPGTNSYLVGRGDVAVIDPGPDLEEHIDALIRAAAGSDGQGRIRWVLASHTHPDHSPAAARLKALTGAQLIGLPPPPHGPQDRSFIPDRQPADNEVLAIAGCHLKVLHVPGHASNQVCYLLQEEGLLFTGDHLMQGSTVVIAPPDGNMSDYLRSLERLKQEDLAWLAPGHGFLLDKPEDAVDRLVLHRSWREKTLFKVLKEKGPNRLEDVVAAVYYDVPERLLKLAGLSLLAHAQKLEREGRVTCHLGLWRVS